MASKSGLIRFALATALGLTASNAVAQNAGWVTAWAASQQNLGEAKISNATVRLIARVTIPGEAVRIRLDNTYGTAPVTFARASIAPRVRGAAVAYGLVQELTFRGKGTVTIPAAGTAESDPVTMHIDAQQDLAVSLFVSGNAQPSQHGNAVVTSYVTDNNAGDATDSVDGKPFTGRTTSMYWLKAIHVRPTAPATAIVAYGDSITDGTCTTLDAHDRWEDLVGQRLALQTPVRFAIVNEGIGGNTVTNDADYQPAINSAPGVERLERDVLSHPGVSHVVLFMGTNDIRRGASADLVMAGMKDIITRVKAKGIKIVGATIIPRHASVPGVADTGWNDAKSKIRHQVNDWIRKDAGFDSVLDFDRVIASKANPDLMEQAYNCGDGIHPAPIGYFQMGKSVDLGAFGK
ncbi:MAG: GDSL-type esterase/lipase family protein [Bryobacteraceae bacterium]|jgi:lysophospholipase L1-like esterase